MLYTLIYSILVILILVVVLDYSIEVKPDAREPRYIAPKIPLVGHLIGIFIKKQPYFVELRYAYSPRIALRNSPSKINPATRGVESLLTDIFVGRKQHPSLPIYGLSVLGSSIYIVNSPDIAVAVQRNAKSLSFVAYGAQFADSVFGLSGAGRKILLENIRGDNGVTGFGHDYINTAHYALAFGPRLDELTQSVVKGLTVAANKLARTTSPKIRLSEWIRRELTLAASNAVYGPANPLADDATDAAYLHFERGLTGLLFLPRFIARKADEGRRHTVETLTRYLQTKAYLTGSGYVQSRVEVGPKYNMSMDDTARMELGGLTALTSTANPTAFWLTCAIYSRPALLEALREELQCILDIDSSNSETRSYTLDVTKVKENCPLFVSVFQETLRHVSLGATIRLVLDDTPINDRYLLKKNAVIMIPAATLHSDPAVFGPEADQFDPYRFVPKAKGTNHKVPQGGFRAFGGGTSLCPGRHFAVTEIFALVGLLVLRYDLTPIAKDGEWRIPAPNTNNMAVAVPAAQGDIEVSFKLRKGWDGDWKAVATPLTTKFDPVVVS